MAKDDFQSKLKEGLPKIPLERWADGPKDYGSARFDTCASYVTRMENFEIHVYEILDRTYFNQTNIVEVKRGNKKIATFTEEYRHPGSTNKNGWIVKLVRHINEGKENANNAEIKNSRRELADLLS